MRLALALLPLAAMHDHKPTDKHSAGVVLVVMLVSIIFWPVVLGQIFADWRATK